MLRVPGKKLNQQFLAQINWKKIIVLCSKTTGALTVFVSGHNQHQSFTNLVEYLCLGLLATTYLQIWKYGDMLSGQSFCSETDPGNKPHIEQSDHPVPRHSKGKG